MMVFAFDVAQCTFLALAKTEASDRLLGMPGEKRLSVTGMAFAVLTVAVLPSCATRGVNPKTGSTTDFDDTLQFATSATPCRTRFGRQRISMCKDGKRVTW
jgi:hypothetical protein